VKETKYLTLQECLTLHAELIRRFGGAPGTRDLGLLESALARPRSGYYETLSQQAAALLQSLASNPCFLDGNKRVAFSAMAIFLRMNGYKLKGDTNAWEKFLLKRVIDGKADVAEIAAFIEKKMSPA
jgi:death-on-curing protein